MADKNIKQQNGKTGVCENQDLGTRTVVYKPWSRKTLSSNEVLLEAGR